MNASTRIDLSTWGEQPPLFVTLLAREVEQSNRTRAAERIGMSRSAVSLILSNRYPSPSTAGVERRVLDALGRIECVAIGDVVTVEQCQTYRARPAPTHNPMAMQHWRACQHCPSNPNCNANAQEQRHVRH
ncbi:helix-turn-helix domain-containing protein [Aquipseudomonas campi]